MRQKFQGIRCFMQTLLCKEGLLLRAGYATKEIMVSRVKELAFRVFPCLPASKTRRPRVIAVDAMATPVVVTNDILPCCSRSITNGTQLFDQLERCLAARLQYEVSINVGKVRRNVAKFMNYFII